MSEPPRAPADHTPADHFLRRRAAGALFGPWTCPDCGAELPAMTAEDEQTALDAIERDHPGLLDRLDESLGSPASRPPITRSGVEIPDDVAGPSEPAPDAGETYPADWEAE